MIPTKDNSIQFTVKFALITFPPVVAFVAMMIRGSRDALNFPRFSMRRSPSKTLIELITAKQRGCNGFPQLNNEPVHMQRFPSSYLPINAPHRLRQARLKYL